MGWSVWLAEQWIEDSGDNSVYGDSGREERIEKKCQD